ncbi:MAG: CotH kinase family protein [Candidatus Omnitrophica bacterium]|nr:CotH kinase family protein [Candidatus Omnitrophota bacterium]
MNRMNIACKRFLGFVCLSAASMVVFCDDFDVVINEIFYYPDSDLQQEEFIELYNRGDELVSLDGWAFSKGVSYIFPENARIEAHGYLLAARDVDVLTNLAPGKTIFGNYEGRLSDSGERLALYNDEGVIIDAVEYKDAPPWPTRPDGAGSSLERISPYADSSNIANWASAKENISQSDWLITPGSQNSVYSENLPPFVENVSWNPASPEPFAAVTVQVHITDEDGAAQVRLHYKPVRCRQTSLGEKTLEMQRVSGEDQDGVWSAEAPGQPDRTLVRFWIEIVDAKGVSQVYPAATEARQTLTYFHYADEERSTIPIVFLYDFGGRDDPDALRNDSAFVIRYPDREGWEVYDYINTTSRTRLGDGYDIRFLKHYELDDMSSINVIFEPKTRYALSEWLSYQVYHSLGVITGNVDHYRFNRNDIDYGYYLMFEQPNKHFIARNGLNNEGNLYKLHWSYDRNTSAAHISELHEKRTNLSSGKEDIIETIQTLHNLGGSDQTLYIESHFAVNQFINYYVGCQIISDWDGYFNNHFVYHDTEGSDLWFVFPWDKDKTWGDSDAYRDILPYYDFYDFPILFGAYGTPRSGTGSGAWWRPPGYFSGPILANADLQLQYLYRLGYAARQEFTEERWIPVIDALEAKLEPEIRHKAEITGSNVNSLLNNFHTEIESLRRQVINRRQFIIAEVENLVGPVSVGNWSLY